jgi:hypothetical protein
MNTVERRYMDPIGTAAITISSQRRREAKTNDWYGVTRSESQRTRKSLVS